LIFCAILMTFMWNLNEGGEVWLKVLIESKLNLVWISWNLRSFYFWPSNLLLLFSVYFFTCWQQFFWILDIKNLVKLRKTINKIRVTASFFVLIFFFVLSQLSQATLRPKLLNFVQKLCPFKRLIYDLILKWRSVGGC